MKIHFVENINQLRVNGHFLGGEIYHFFGTWVDGSGCLKVVIMPIGFPCHRSFSHKQPCSNVAPTFALTLILLGPESLSNLRVSVPSIVLRGETTSFNCSWDMEPIDKVTGMMIINIWMMVMIIIIMIMVMTMLIPSMPIFHCLFLVLWKPGKNLFSRRCGQSNGTVEILRSSGSLLTRTHPPKSLSWTTSMLT